MLTHVPHSKHPCRLASPIFSNAIRQGNPVFKSGAGPGRRSSSKVRPVFCSLSLSIASSWAAACDGKMFLPWAAAHAPGILESVGEGGVVRETVFEALGGITGSSAIAALAWTTMSMLLYSARRAHLHGLSTKVVLARHFINGFDEQPHPYFPVAFAGWLLFLSVYIPVELLLMTVRCSIFYYYYPSACGAGFMVERVAQACKKPGMLRALRANERQIIRVDWYVPVWITPQRYSLTVFCARV